MILSLLLPIPVLSVPPLLSFGAGGHDLPSRNSLFPSGSSFCTVTFIGLSLISGVLPNVLVARKSCNPRVRCQGHILLPEL